MHGAAGFAAIQPGAEREFNALVRETYRWAYNVAYRRLRDAGESEDLVQEAFLRAWRGFPGFDRGASFKGWLYRIIVNLIIDRSRRKKQVLTCSLDTGIGLTEDPGFDAGFVSDTREGPESLAIASNERAEINAALNVLPPKFGSVLRLYAQGERSYQEIADATGCSIGTVRSRLHRARRLLRDSLGPAWTPYSTAVSLDEKLAKAA